MIKQTTAEIQTPISDQMTDRGEDGLALRVIATAVRVKLYEQDMLDERNGAGASAATKS